jgi:hypothetical protein
MTLSVAARPSAVATPALPARPAVGDTGPRSYFRGPGWPLAVALVPFALWWAMGITEIVCVAMAVPMALYLVRQRRVDVPRGFGFWLLFLCIFVAGVAVLQIAAVGAVADHSATRYLTWGYRLVWYLTCTIAALYVISIRKHVPFERISRIVSYFFITVVAGGVLGLVAPHLQFHSLLELLLPGSVTSNQFIQSIIHPSAAQLQDVLGHQAPRPSAPFAYSNTWGMNFCVTLPFFIHSWCGRRAGWRRWAAVFVLIVAAVTAIESINRGMWLTLAVMAVFLAIRSAFAARVAPLVGLALAGAAVAVLCLSTPLGTVISDRLSNPGSEQGRQNLASLTATSVLRTSPVIGLGNTRYVQGNFSTIAGGATALCPRCRPPALGTQGQLWLVLYSQGLLGLALFAAFFGVLFFTYLRQRTAAVTLGLSVILASAVTSPFYNSLGTGLMVVMIAVGLLSCEGLANARRPLLPAALGNYAVPLLRWAPALLLCTILGALAGNAISSARPAQATAVATVVIPTAPNKNVFPISNGPMSVDTVAQLLRSSQVSHAVERASGNRPVPGDGRLTVSATPNSRTLHIAYKARTAAQARAGANAAAANLLDIYHRLYVSERAASLRALNAQSKSMDLELRRLNRAIRHSITDQKRPGSLLSTIVLLQQRTSLATQLSHLRQQISNATAAVGQVGARPQPTTVRVSKDARLVDVVTGATVAFVLGALGALALARRGRRLSRRAQVFEETNLPVLARLSLRDDALNTRVGDPEAADVVATAAVVHDFGSCVAADASDFRAVMLAEQVQDLPVVRRGDPRKCVVVASQRTRTATVNQARAVARRRGLSVVGAITFASSTRTRPEAARHLPSRHRATNAAD